MNRAPRRSGATGLCADRSSPRGRPSELCGAEALGRPADAPNPPSRPSQAHRHARKTRQPPRSNFTGTASVLPCRQQAYVPSSTKSRIFHLAAPGAARRPVIDFLFLGAGPRKPATRARRIAPTCLVRISPRNMRKHSASLLAILWEVRSFGQPRPRLLLDPTFWLRKYRPPRGAARAIFEADPRRPAAVASSDARAAVRHALCARWRLYATALERCSKTPTPWTAPGPGSDCARRRTSRG